MQPFRVFGMLFVASFASADTVIYASPCRSSARITETMPRNTVVGAGQRLKKTLLDHLDVFRQHENDLGRTSLIQHQINTGNNASIKQASRRVLLAKREEMESLIESTKGPGVTILFVHFLKSTSR